MITFLVRHGDAGDKRSWDGPDVGRPLSPAGFRQAEGLVVRLEDYPVERILCSPTVRCHQTVQPLARDRLLPIEPVAALGVDAGTQLEGRPQPGAQVALWRCGRPPGTLLHLARGYSWHALLQTRSWEWWR